MPYTAEISRSNPSAFILLLDQSSSMADPFAGGGQSKAVEAARAVNHFLEELSMKCAKEVIYDYYEVGVLGYGGGVASAFGGGLSSSDLLPISRIGDTPLRIDQLQRKVSDGTGGLVEETTDVPVWIDPRADGMTPMCQALVRAHDLAEQWAAGHAKSYPITVLNVTDGEANDGDPTESAEALRQVATDDGRVLLFNCHLSSKRGPTVQFPAAPEGLVDDFARQLYEMSSELPPAQLEVARSEGFSVSPGSRGFIFNADLADLIRFIDIGTRATLR